MSSETPLKHQRLMSIYSNDGVSPYPYNSLHAAVQKRDGRCGYDPPTEKAHQSCRRGRCARCGAHSPRR